MNAFRYNGDLGEVRTSSLRTKPDAAVPATQIKVACFASKGFPSGRAAPTHKEIYLCIKP